MSTKRPMRQALDWAKRVPTGQGATHVVATAEQLLLLQAHLYEALSPKFHDHCRVARIDQGVINVLVSSAAMATRLRHLEPDVIAHLSGKGWNVRQLRLKIQPNPMVQSQISRSIEQNKRVITSDIKSNFKWLEENLADGPLRDSVSKLLRGKT